MDELRRLAVLEMHLADLKRESERSRRSAVGTGRVSARGTIIILMAVLMVGMIAWWVH